MITSLNFSNDIQLLFDVINSNDFDDARNILNQNLSPDQPSDFLFELITEISVRTLDGRNNYLEIIYIVIDLGIDINLTDEHGNNCLFYAVQNRNPELCTVLLQCGADIWEATEFGTTIYDYVMCTETSKEVKDAFEKYYPGLWRAVESENIYQVRKLINLWCRTDLCKQEFTLRNLAFQTGNEEIINLILGIFESMKMVYYILARNIQSVRQLFQECPKTLRLDLRKMSDKGAPILFYLIQQKNLEAIELFIQHGCKIHTVMQDDCGHDMPVIFSAIRPGVPVVIIEALLPENKTHLLEMLHKILYKGKTILEIALERHVSVDVFTLLIHRGGPLLLSDRNIMNQTVCDIAVLSGRVQYVHAIDQVIKQWFHDSKRRQLLALHGWRFDDIEHFEVNNKNDSDVEDFLLQLKTYQDLIKDMFEFMECGDVDNCIKSSETAAKFPLFDERILWNGRIVGDKMPLLHRAILFNRLDLVHIILKNKLPSESIDCLFDQFHRTALHYAYASSATKEIQKLLLDYGCSEHVLDKMNKEPLDFRDKQDTPLMMALLDRLKMKAFDLEEPNPWNDDDIKSNIKPTKCTCMPTHSQISNFSSDEDSGSEVSYEEQPRTFCVVT
ncbi:uncharacterized protein LOC129229737 [Uloborus diversus]|uniref:uncharacterized protein LOC129229737 n=1 Tax=Uloborus diversus TaxID=327109 RepID=UPI0024092800|nr:uncharacterized protein LOC129229737 [Uloborus diversus]